MTTLSQIEPLEHVRCNLCGRDDPQLQHVISGFQIVRCRNCSLIYVNPRLSKEQTHQLYTHSEYFQNKSFYGPDGSAVYGYGEYLSQRQEIERSFEKIIHHLARFQSPGNLFEVGCGPGYLLNVARRHGWRVAGTEVSPYACRYAQEELGLNVSSQPLEEGTFSANSFDAGVMLDVVEHLHDPLSSLQAMHRLLKPGGVLVIGTPNAGSWVARILGPRWEDMRRVKEHLYLFSDRTLGAMLEKSGFRVGKTIQYGRYFQIGQILKRLEIYHEGLANGLARISRGLRLYNKVFYIVPFTKIIVFAKKLPDKGCQRQ